MTKESVLIVGTVSNVSNVIPKDFERVFQSLSRFQSISTYLVESDSTDNTNKVLSELKRKYSNFEYVELGTLRNTIPDRIERIRFCRNVYVKFIRDNIKEKNWEFIIVVDLDGMNSKLTQVAVDSCFEDPTDWDACFANQKYGYYDLYALRHPEWMPRDCFIDLEMEKNKIPPKYWNTANVFAKFNSEIRFGKARKVAIYNKMRVIKKNASWIKVDSAFGGFAIYKSRLLIEADYSKNPIENSRTSEHVDLHSNLLKIHPNLYINPKLINSFWNTYNVNRYFLVRFLRHKLKDYSKIIKIGRRIFLPY